MQITSSTTAARGPDGLIGRQLGRYSLERILGRGGTATVYRAVDVALQRPVALKLLDPSVAAQPGFRERFRQEARLIAGLRHPNIVQVYDLGEFEGSLYMVQELLPGPTLAQRVGESAARGIRLPPDEVMAIVGQLAAALDTAHAAGVIHRDVKPANAIWSAAGALVLTDFGIAKQLKGELAQTQTGIVFGTPRYLSPEQAQGLPLTPASDVYALGVVLYELLAGRPPFDGITPLSVAVSHIHTPPPSLAAQIPGLPADVEAVVRQALAKRPEERFRSAGALARALGHVWSAPRQAGAAALHQQTTHIWPVPPVALGPTTASPTLAPPAPVAPARPAAKRPAASGGTRAQAAPGGGGVRRRRRSGLPALLGGALLLVFLAGGVVARGAGAPQAPVATQQAELLPAPTVPPMPTVAPMSTVAAPGDPFGQLGALLAGSDGGGPGARAVRELRRELEAAARALRKGDAEEAADRLRELRRRLAKGAAAGELSPAFVEQAVGGIEALAADYGLSLAPEDEGEDEDD